MTTNKWKPIPMPGKYAVRILATKPDLFKGDEGTFADILPMVKDAIQREEEDTKRLATASLLTLASFDTPVGHYLEKKLQLVKPSIDIVSCQIALDHIGDIVDLPKAEDALILTTLISSEKNVVPDFRRVERLEPCVNGDLSFLSHATFNNPTFKSRMQMIMEPFGDDILMSEDISEIIYKLKTKYSTRGIDAIRVEKVIREIQPLWYQQLYDMQERMWTFYPRLGFISLSDCLSGLYRGIFSMIDRDKLSTKEVFDQISSMRTVLKKARLDFEIKKIAKQREEEEVEAYNSAEDQAEQEATILEYSKQVDKLIEFKETPVPSKVSLVQKSQVPETALGLKRALEPDTRLSRQKKKQVLPDQPIRKSDRNIRKNA